MPAGGKDDIHNNPSRMLHSRIWVLQEVQDVVQTLEAAAKRPLPLVIPCSEYKTVPSVITLVGCHQCCISLNTFQTGPIARDRTEVQHEHASEVPKAASRVGE